MSPEVLSAARQSMGFSRGELAAVLRMGENGRRLVRRWEEGDTSISGPASVAIDALMTGWRPAEFSGDKQRGLAE